MVKTAVKKVISVFNSLIESVLAFKLVCHTEGYKNVIQGGEDGWKAPGRASGHLCKPTRGPRDLSQVTERSAP